MSDRDTLYDLLDGLLPEREIVRSDIAGAMVEAIEAAGWRPPAPVVTTVEELDALPVGSAILLDYGVILQAYEVNLNVIGWLGIADHHWRTSARVVDDAGVGATIIVLHAPVVEIAHPEN